MFLLEIKNMFIKEIILIKSKTVGIMQQGGKTHFKKIQISASAELNENDDSNKSYQELSQYIESKFEYEKNN